LYTTHGYDVSRDNVYSADTVFTASSFPTLTTTSNTSLNGAVYAQPLYIHGLAVGSGSENVLYVATEENYVYALDATTLATSSAWSTNPVNLNGTGESAVEDSDLPGMCPNINPEVGITGTPVIDLTGTAPANVMYLVTKEEYDVSGVENYTQRIVGLSIQDGSIVVPAMDIPSAMSGTLGVTFDALAQNQRAALALDHDPDGDTIIYVAWGSHCDMGTYSGKVAAFEVNESGGSYSFQLLQLFDDEPTSVTNHSDGGIWMAGGAPAIDPSSHDLFLPTGNGYFQYNSSSPSAFGQSILRLSLGPETSFTVNGFYTPKQWAILNGGSASGYPCTGTSLALPAPSSFSTLCAPSDFDLGSGGATIATPQGSVSISSGDSFVVLAAGKEGVIYDLAPSQMNFSAGADTSDPCTTYVHGTNHSPTLQCLSADQLPSDSLYPNSDDVGTRNEVAFWSGNSSNVENVLYVAGSRDAEIRAYQMTKDGSGNVTGLFNTSTLFGSQIVPAYVQDLHGNLRYPGASPVISWNSASGASTDATLWILSTNLGLMNQAVALYAYPAVPPSGTTFGTPIFSDTTSGPFPTTFSVPTVADGHVFVGGKYGSSCSIPCTGEVVSWHP
jgi:hypothetical protein